MKNLFLIVYILILTSMADACGPVPDDTFRFQSNSLGQLIIVWEEDCANGRIIMSKTKSEAGTWKDPVVLSLEGQESYKPIVKVEKNGHAIALWMGKDLLTGYSSLLAAMLAPGGKWSRPAVLTEANENVISNSYRAVADNNGNAVATWSSIFIHPEGYVIKKRIRSASAVFGEGIWSGPQSLNENHLQVN